MSRIWRRSSTGSGSPKEKASTGPGFAWCSIAPNRAIVHAIPAAPTNRFIPTIGGSAASATGDYTLRLETKALKVEEALDPRDITTWTPNGKVVTINPNLAKSTGAKLGVIGSGGALPDGWDRNNSVGTVEVLQLDPLRIKISRSGGAPTGTTTALRPITYAARVQNTSGGPIDYALRAGVRVVSSVGVDSVTLAVQELSASDAFMSQSAVAAPATGAPASAIRTIPNNSKTVPNVAIGFGNAVDFSITLEFSEMPSVGPATVAYPPALVEAPTLTGVPAGTYDVLQLGAGSSHWRRGVAVADTLQLVLPPKRGLHVVRQAVLLPANSSFDQRLDMVDALNPIAFEPLIFDPFEREASVGGYSCGVDGPTAPWSMARATNRQRVMRYEVRPGDHDPRDIIQDGGTTTRERCELRIGYDWAYEVDQWIAWSWLLLPGDPVIEDKIAGDFCSLGQVHDGGIAGEKNYSNSLGTGLYQDDRWGIFAATNPDSTTTAGYRRVIEYQDMDPTPRGVFQHMVARFRFSLTAGGRVQIWKNAKPGDAPLVDYAGPIGFSGSPGLYWKEGIYRGQRPSALAVLFANLEFGADLSALIGNPRDVA